jgi:DNA polymerase-3 subunit delta
LLIEECQHLDIRLSRQAALLLVEFMGNDLRTLINECEKLHAFTMAHVIEVHHVRSVSVLDAQTFSVVDAWLQRRLTHRSMHDLNALLVHDAPIKFLALLSSRVNYYYRLKRGLAVGQSIETLAQSEGKKTFPVQKDLEKVRGLTLNHLEVLKRRLLEVEFRLKRGEDNPVLLLEQFMLSNSAS